MNFGSLDCCGIRECRGLSAWFDDREGESLFHALTYEGGGLSAAWVCFNGVKNKGYVEAFAKFLEQNNLGKVITLPDLVNPNSSNLLDVRMWAIDRDALRTWWQERAKKGPCGCYTCHVNPNNIKNQTEAHRQARLTSAGLLPRTPPPTTQPQYVQPQQAASNPAPF